MASPVAELNVTPPPSPPPSIDGEQKTPPLSPSAVSDEESEYEQEEYDEEDEDYTPSSRTPAMGKKRRLQRNRNRNQSEETPAKREKLSRSASSSVEPILPGISNKKQKKEKTRVWADDGCITTFHKRLDEFQRILSQEDASFYSNPRPSQPQPNRPTSSTTIEAETKEDDELDDSDFHDAAAVADVEGAEITATEGNTESETQCYTADDVYQTDSGLLVPTYIYAHLFPHQKECLEWLHHLHDRNTGGILGDEMGLGKTVQIAAFLGSMRHAQRLRTVLLLCPASVLLHWVREFHKWYPPMRVVLLHASGTGVAQAGRTYGELIEEVTEVESGCGGVIISTYENVRQYQELFLEVEWDYVVLDEGHRIRNPDAEITLVCKQFKTIHRLILTGTPIQNQLRELWSLFDFVYPGKLGTLPTFEDEFVLPIRTGGYANASKMQVLMAYKCALVLKDLITPFLMRRTKKEIQEVTKMPEKMEHILFCNLTSRQISAYRSFLGSQEVAKVLRRDIRPFRAIAILRHICNHPDLLSTIRADGPATSFANAVNENEDYGCIEASGKMVVLQKILGLWKDQQHRVLLFTQTRKMLDILESMMAKLRYKYCRLDGTTNVKERQRLLDAFNAEGSQIFIFLLTTRAGGIGVNLVGADRVVVFDPDWNPSTDLQARERSWRLGQTKQVTIYRLITSGTIEEKIYHRQIFKQYLTTKVLHDAKRKRCFNKHSLRDLFVLGEQKGENEHGEDGGSVETTEMFLAGQVENPVRAANTTTATNDDGEDVVMDVEEGEDVGGDKDTEESSGKGDNDAILKELFSGDHVRGVFNHDVVESDGIQNQEAELIDMESTKIAKSALSALRASCALIRQQRETLFTPTWTGRSGVAGDPSQRESSSGRFGNRVARGRRPLTGMVAAAASSSSSGNNLFGQQSLSSRDMLAKIKARRNGLTTSSDSSSAGPTLKNGFMTVNEMTKQLHAFLTPTQTDPTRRNGVTTEQLLDAFGDLIAPKDKLVFRNLLREMAVCRGRKWVLKQDFETAS